MKKLLLIILSFTLFACNDDDFTEPEPTLRELYLDNVKGKWEIQSYYTDGMWWDISNTSDEYWEFAHDNTYIFYNGISDVFANYEQGIVEPLFINDEMAHIRVKEYNSDVWRTIWINEFQEDKTATFIEQYTETMRRFKKR